MITGPPKPEKTSSLVCSFSSPLTAQACYKLYKLISSFHLDPLTEILIFHQTVFAESGYKALHLWQVRRLFWKRKKGTNCQQNKALLWRETGGHEPRIRHQFRLPQVSPTSGSSTTTFLNCWDVTETQINMPDSLLGFSVVIRLSYRSSTASNRSNQRRISANGKLCFFFS